MPANTGAEAEVPPIIDPVGFPCTSVKFRAFATPVEPPGAQALPVPDTFSSDNCVQKMYPGKFGVARSEISGEKRTLAWLGMETVCHVG